MDKVLYTFTCTKVHNNSDKFVEHTYICSEDEKWDGVMLQFAEFLESVGFCGVVDNVEGMVDDM